MTRPLVWLLLCVIPALATAQDEPLRLGFKGELLVVEPDSADHPRTIACRRWIRRWAVCGSCSSTAGWWIPVRVNRLMNVAGSRKKKFIAARRAARSSAIRRW